MGSGSKVGDQAKILKNKKKVFIIFFIRIIASRDTPKSLFYCDPPYFNNNCGHYDGYTIEDFEMLLKRLSGIEGMFLLSSYPSPLLRTYTRRFKWHTMAINQDVSINAKSGKINAKSGKLKAKTEVLTTNYPVK